MMLLNRAVEPSQEFAFWKCNIYSLFSEFRIYANSHPGGGGVAVGPQKKPRSTSRKESLEASIATSQSLSRQPPRSTRRQAVHMSPDPTTLASRLASGFNVSQDKDKDPAVAMRLNSGAAETETLTSPMAVTTPSATRAGAINVCACVRGGPFVFGCFGVG